jgi:dihydroneopterin triphosphate diphosphatase
MTSLTSHIVEVCVFRFANNVPEYLLLRRSGESAVYPGLWQCVTGRIEEGEKAWQAALREVGEETGLVPVRFWSVPHVSTFYDPQADQIHLCPFFAVQVARDAVPVLSAEHGAWEWLEIRRAAGRLVWPSQKQGFAVVQEEIMKGKESSRLTILDVPV